MITLNNIYKIYKNGGQSVNALDGVSLFIGSGEFVSIIGTSGSGKSTLMNMIGCLDTPTRGGYFLDGKDVSRLSDKALSKIRNSKIGFIFQGFNLVGSLTALENVELPLLYRGIPRKERKVLAHEALTSVGLSHRIHHRPSEMSGGQQQRVAIARAIAASPPIILADEPTGNLDTSSSAEIMEILTNLSKSGRTVIIITHDNEIAKKTNRLIKIIDGKIKKE